MRCVGLRGGELLQGALIRDATLVPLPSLPARLIAIVTERS